MKTSPVRTVPSRAKGLALLDSLAAIVVISIGVLGLVALQGTFMKNNAEAKHRAEAAFLAAQVIGQMWQEDDKAALAAQYRSPDGPKFLLWRTEVQDGKSGLPSATGDNEPTIKFSSANRVLVTVRWQVAGHGPHRHVAEAQICGTDGCPSP